MSLPQTLRIRCPTWDHLENFYERKIKDDNVLLARVPFSPLIGSSLTIALELPDASIVNIEASIEGVKQAPDGRKSAIRMVLSGLDAAMRSRLERAVEQGRRGHARARPLSEAPPTVPRTQTGLPVPIPADVPINELVPVITLPKAEEVPDAVRAQYIALQKELKVLREKAAHEVLGVAYEAEVAEIRQAYFAMVKKFHPDVVGRHGSPEIDLLASEIFIYVNKAYDRLRDSAVATGRAFIAGPALLPQNGWIADFEDIGTVKPRVPLRSDDLSIPVAMAAAAAAFDSRGADSVSVRFKGQADSQEERAQREGASAAASGDEPSARATGKATRMRHTDLFIDARKTEQGMHPLGGGESDAQDADEEVLRARIRSGEESLLAEDFDAARELFADALEHFPRSRRARALYHVAYGQTLLERGKAVEAMTQFEVALKHDPTCQFARGAKSSIRSERKKRPSLFKRFFGR